MLAHGAASDDPAHAHRRLAVAGMQAGAARQLYDLAAERRPGASLEVGLAYGVSTLALCDAYAATGNDCRHVAIDPFQLDEWGDVGLTNLTRAGHADRVRLLRERSDDALVRLIGEGLRVDLALVDGSHLFDYALVDLFLVDRLLDVGGVVVVDDLWMPGVRRAAAFFLSNRAYTLLKVPAPAEGIGRRVGRAARRLGQRPFLGHLPLKLRPGNLAFLRKDAEDGRRWDHFAPF